MAAAGITPQKIRLFHPEFGAQPTIGQVVQVVHPHRPSHDLWAQAGFDTAAEAGDDPVDLAIVQVTKSKTQSRNLIAQAARGASHVMVDGDKTLGIDSQYKALRKILGDLPTVTKAHGRAFWFPSDALLPHLEALATGPLEFPPFRTVPGVFSEKGPDRGSQVLLAHLPPLAGRGADFGAGWGYLAAHVLQSEKLTALDLIEADFHALACAKHAIDDPRAQFHWADVTTYQDKYDFIVMNPPFHARRTADVDLGRAFIQSAARNLTDRGAVWMVANRQLPYEAELDTLFARVETVAQEQGFKVICASRPRAKARLR